MRRALLVAPKARIQIRDALAWWREKREKAPRALAEELKATIALVREQPGVGRRVKDLPRILQLPIRRVRYTLYYQEWEGAIEIVAFWHSNRGSKPPLG
jgi:plasmid stabilization system protein ParE